MSMASVRRSLRMVDEFLRPSRAEDRSIPVLDGGLAPNDALDSFDVLWSGSRVDGVTSLGSDVVIASGSTLFVVDPDTRQAGPPLELGAPVGALAPGAGAVYAVAADGVVARLAAGPAGSLEVEHSLTTGLSCPTDAHVEGDTLFVTSGSAAHPADQWKRDLMTRGSTGSVQAVDLSTGAARQITTGLAWAGGVVVDPGDAGRLIVSESWRHRLRAVRIEDGSTTDVGDPLPGYPTSLSLQGSDVLVSFLSLRTHLIEFVLREDAYREQMVRTIDPEFWLAPSLRITNERWEPLQIGSLKHLNVTKPWAPPRAYGLVARMHRDGVYARSWHARVGSPRSGVVGAAILGGRLVVASKGAGDVLISKEDIDD